jgi:hypothetical protein
VRLALERATPDELQKLLQHGLQKAGAVKLMTPELIATLADHAQGNPRALMIIAGELLAVPGRAHEGVPEPKNAIRPAAGKPRTRLPSYTSWIPPEYFPLKFRCKNITAMKFL